MEYIQEALPDNVVSLGAYRDRRALEEMSVIKRPLEELTLAELLEMEASLTEQVEDNKTALWGLRGYIESRLPDGDGGGVA